MSIARNISIGTSNVLKVQVPSNQDIRPGILGTKYVAKIRPLVLIRLTVWKIGSCKSIQMARHPTNPVLVRRRGAWRNQGRGPWWESHHVKHTGRPHIIPNHSPLSGNLTQVRRRPSMVGSWVAGCFANGHCLLMHSHQHLMSVRWSLSSSSSSATCLLPRPARQVSLSYP